MLSRWAVLRPGGAGDRRGGIVVRPRAISTLATLAGVAAAAAADEARRRASEAERRATGHRERSDALERDLRALEQALRRERALGMRLEQSRRAERQFSRDLRHQLQEAFSRREALATQESDGVPLLVLRAAVGLVEAEKGLLLAAADEDHDGKLDLAASIGFEHDPADSAVAQRFARRVLDRDETVREDEDDLRASELKATEADDEIRNLAAVPVYLRDRFHGVVVCVNREGGFADVDDDLLLAVGDGAGDALHTRRLRRDLHDAHTAAVRVLLEALAIRDHVLHQHSAAAAVLASRFAQDLDMEDGDREVLVLATLLRDLGYIGIPERLLVHSGPLSLDERSIVELHPRLGFSMLRRLPALHEVAYAVLYHHEHHDGSGYPYALAGEEIPLAARAVAVIDAYSAMTNDRPYRDALSSEAACAEIVAGAGAQFDPELAALFVEHVRRHPEAPDEGLVEAVAQALPLQVTPGDGTALGILLSPDVDPLTQLPAQRACLEELARRLDDCAEADVVAVLLVQAEEVERLNETAGHLAGDRLIQSTAKAAERVAARLHGSAFRVSGRRMAVIFDCAEPRVHDAVREVNVEFATGPTISTSTAAGRLGDNAAALLVSARTALSSSGDRI